MFCAWLTDCLTSFYTNQINGIPINNELSDRGVIAFAFINENIYEHLLEINRRTVDLKCIAFSEIMNKPLIFISIATSAYMVRNTYYGLWYRKGTLKYVLLRLSIERKWHIFYVISVMPNEIGAWQYVEVTVRDSSFFFT